MGPKMPERGSKTSKLPVVWATFGIILARSKWFPVAIGGHGQNLAMHYDPEAKKQSMEWRHSGSLRPKKFRVQKFTGKVFASIFWENQDGILLIDYLPKDKTVNVEYYSSLLVQLKDISKEKSRGKFTKRVLFLHDNARLAGHLQPWGKWPNWAYNVLITHPNLRIWRRRTTTCSLDWKTIESSPFFVRRGGHCCRGDQVGRRTFWIFLSGLQKLEQRAKKYIKLCGEYVE